MNLIKNLSKDFEKYYFANSVLGIIVSSCLGSIAAMMILADGNSILHIIHLTWIVIICMTYNATVIVNFNHKWIFYLQIISVLSSILSVAYFILW